MSAEGDSRRFTTLGPLPVLERESPPWCVGCLSFPHTHDLIDIFSVPCWSMRESQFQGEWEVFLAICTSRHMCPTNARMEREMAAFDWSIVKREQRGGV